MHCAGPHQARAPETALDRLDVARARNARVKDKACRAVREYLATLDDAAFGAASPVTPKFISRSDPAAQWTGAHKGHAFFAYATNYLIDTAVWRQRL